MKSDIRAFVLAGGKGSRSENPSIPKILQKIEGNVDLLSLILEAISKSNINNVTLLLGFLYEPVLQRLTELIPSFPTLNIKWHIDSELKGTHNAVVQALQVTDEGKIALILGDLAISGDFKRAMRSWQESKKQIGILCHPNLHPEDSDRFLINEEHEAVVFIPKNSDIGKNPLPNLAVGGVFFFEREALESKEFTSSDVVYNLVNGNSNSLKIINSSIYFKDSGTPKRLRQIQNDYRTGHVQRRGANSRQAIFLDRDGTLVPNAGTARRAFERSDFESGALTALREVNNQGIPLFLVSNQPGVAKGEITFSQLMGAQAELQQFLLNDGVLIDDFRFCPHHPHTGFDGEVLSLKITCKCRKPNSGLLEELAELHGIDLQQSFMIGDSDADHGAAVNCGAKYLKGVFGSESHSVEKAVLRAIEGILN